MWQKLEGTGGEEEKGGYEQGNEGMKIERWTYYTISRRRRKRFCQLYVASWMQQQPHCSRAIQSVGPAFPPPTIPVLMAHHIVQHAVAATVRLCVSRYMPFVTIQDADAECRASFAAEWILHRGLRWGGGERGTLTRLCGRCVVVFRGCGTRLCKFYATIQSPLFEGIVTQAVLTLALLWICKMH